MPECGDAAEGCGLLLAAEAAGALCRGSKARCPASLPGAPWGGPVLPRSCWLPAACCCLCLSTCEDCGAAAAELPCRCMLLLLLVVLSAAPCSSSGPSTAVGSWLLLLPRGEVMPAAPVWLARRCESCLQRRSSAFERAEVQAAQLQQRTSAGAGGSCPLPALRPRPCAEPLVGTSLAPRARLQMPPSPALLLQPPLARPVGAAGAGLDWPLVADLQQARDSCKAQQLADLASMREQDLPAARCRCRRPGSEHSAPWF